MNQPLKAACHCEAPAKHAARIHKERYYLKVRGEAISNGASGDCFAPLVDFRFLLRILVILSRQGLAMTDAAFSRRSSSQITTTDKKQNA